MVLRFSRTKVVILASNASNARAVQSEAIFIQGVIGHAKIVQESDRVGSF